MSKKMLIFGSSGLAGSKIAEQAKNDYTVYGTFNKRTPNSEKISNIELDLNDSENLKKIICEIQPEIIVNTTALHNVDYCEDNKKESFFINSTVLEKIIEYSKPFESKFVHISTDYVFDGNSSTPYKETDVAKPVSVYGQSKLQGENIVLSNLHTVVRPSVVYGWTSLELEGTVSSSGKPINFAMWLLYKLYKKEPLKIITDQITTATLADSLATSILKIISSEKSGLYHITGQSCESRYDFSLKLAETFGYDTNQISPTDSSQFKQKAKRPSYSCLDCTKAITDFGLDLLTTENALKLMKSQVEKEAPHLIR
jgi:dTDP-4-dehydrorhamnose reductase